MLGLGVLVALAYGFGVTQVPPMLAAPALLAAGLVAAVAAARAIDLPKKRQLKALTTLIAAWSDGDFSCSIAMPRDRELAEVTQILNGLGEVLRRERQAITQRELLLDTVVQNTPTALLISDPSGHVIYANLAARELIGENRKLEGLSLEAVLQRLPPELAQSMREARDALLTLVLLGEDEVFHVSTRDFFLTSRPHRLHMLRRLTRELSRQEVATWKKVIRVLSHELNNSLGPIASLANSGLELLKRSELEMLPTVLETIGERARHLEQFIHSYAEFAKLPAPRLAALHWPELLTPLAASYGVVIVEPLPQASVAGDRAQLEQVLINLTKNALEAGSPPAKTEIAVLLVPGGHQLELRDRGTGMSETVLAQALLPFYSTKRNGTGLGLALAREIVEAHGGRLRLSNQAGGGSVVRLWLPVS